MLFTEFIVSQCSGQELILSLVVAALLLSKLENMSKINVKSQIDCRFVTHPTHSLFAQRLGTRNGGQHWSGVGFLTDLLSPSPPTAVERSGGSTPQFRWIAI